MEDKKSRESFRGIVRLLVRFSLPLIFSGILQKLYNWADAFIVGNTNGELALAAIGATATMVNFSISAMTGFTLGLAILFAQSFGREESASISKLLSTFSIVLGGVFTVLAGLGIWLAPPMLKLLRTTPDTILLAETYLRIIFVGVPFLAVYNVYSAALRGIGNSKAPFYSVLVSSVVNVALDIVFVVFLDWGVAGAAAATVASQAAMTIFLILYGARKYDVLRFRICRKSLDAETFFNGCRFGIPPLLQSSVSSAGSLILQNFMNGFGTQTVAAITTAYRVDTIIVVPIINLGSGISTLVAQKYGSGRKKDARRILYVGMILMTVISLSMTAFVIWAGGYLIALFGVGPETVQIGDEFFRRLASFYLIFGLAVSIRSYLEGTGDVLFSSLVVLTSLASRIIASYAMAPCFGNMTIAYAEGFSWIILLTLYVVRVVWKEHSLRSSISAAR